MRDVYVCPNLHDLALRIDQEGIALGHGDDVVALGELQSEGAIALDHLVIGIGQQMESQRVFRAELLVAVDRIHAHTENDSVGGVILWQVVLEFVSFNRAASGHVLRIEVQHHPLALHAVKRDGRAVLRGKAECGGNLAHRRLICKNTGRIRGHSRAGKHNSSGKGKLSKLIHGESLQAYKSIFKTTEYVRTSDLQYPRVTPTIAILAA